MSRSVSLSDDGVRLSVEIARLSDEFAPLEKDGAAFRGEDIARLRARLALFAKLACRQELELSVHRLIEANRLIHEDIRTMFADADLGLRALRDNVVFFDFTGGRKP